MANLDARDAFNRAVDWFVTGEQVREQAPSTTGRGNTRFSGEWVLTSQASTLGPGADAVQSGVVRESNTASRHSATRPRS